MNRNPYITGSIISQKDNFYDRTELLNELSYQDSRAYYLKGNRQIGKSSLLRQIYQQINENKATQLAILLNLEGCEDETECCRLFRRALAKAVARKPSNLAKETLNTDDFVDLLEHTIHTAKRMGLHLLLLVDEAESLLTLPPRTRARLHPHLVNLHDNLKVILTATSHLYQLNHAEAGKVPFLNGFNTRHIACLDTRDVTNLIRQTQLTATDRPIVDTEVIAEVIRLCGGHPFLTQTMCADLFRVEGLRMPREPDTLLNHMISNLVKMDFNHLELDEQKTLKCFAFQRTIKLRELPDDCRNHVRELLLQGFLLEEHGGYRLSNCFLSQWLEQHENKEVEPLMVESSKAVPKKIFLSYSKSDKEWKEKLKKQLRIYERNEQVTIWEDSQIQPGQMWSEEIDRALAEADIYLFLVSSDLLATDFVMDTELPAALKKHQAGQATVIPVIMRPCQWDASGFSKFQAVPYKGKPVSTYENEDTALNEVVERIKGFL